MIILLRYCIYRKKQKLPALPESFSWAGRIRTFEVTESESVALPLGDSPIMLQQHSLYTGKEVIASIKKVLYNFICPSGS